MAPIQFLFTSAFVLSAVVAAPINSNYVGAGKVDTSAPSKHQSEPMRVAGMGIDTEAMKSSAAAMAIQSAPSTSSGHQSDGVFGILNKLPIKREEEEVAPRQMSEVTEFLTSINSIAKRDGEVEERQLGLIKSVPEAVGQAAQVEKLVASLPIKRDGNGILGGLGGLGGVLGGSVKRDVEEAEKHDETYTEKALKGFQGWIHHGTKDEHETPEIPGIPSTAGLGDIAKRTDPVGSLLNGLLAKRDTEGTETENHKETYTEKALKGFQGWIHHGTKGNKKATPEIPSAADSLGLSNIAKRTDPVGSLLNGIFAKRDTEGAETETHKETYTEKALKGFQGWIHHGTKGDKEATPEKPSAADSLGLTNIAKRNGLDSIDAFIKGLTNAGQLNNGLNIRQLNVLSSLATGALSNAGSAAGKLGKIATGKHRRGNGDAGSITSAATAGLNVGNHHKVGKDDDESADVDEIAADVAEGEQTLHDATSSQGPAGGHLNKRQVPPIAGSDALSVVKGLVANPKTVLTPVTKGILVGGTALGDMAPH